MDWLELTLGRAPESIPSPRLTGGVAPQAPCKNLLVYSRSEVAKAIYVLLVPCLMKPKMVLQSLGAGQREELHRCLDAALVVRVQCSLSDVQRGWILIKVQAQKARCAVRILYCAPCPRMAGFGANLEIQTRRLKITPEEAQLAKFFRAVIAAEVRCQYT